VVSYFLTISFISIIYNRLENKPEFPTVNSPEALVKWFEYAQNYKPFGKQRLKVV